MAKLTKTEYKILKNHLAYIERVIIPDVNGRVTKAFRSGVELLVNYEYEFCKEEQDFYYEMKDRIKELLDTAEVNDVVVFPFKKW